MATAIILTILYFLASALFVGGALDHTGRKGAAFYILFFVWIGLAIATGEAWDKWQGVAQ